ncbi:MAG: M28 family peptidase, partial [Firmicutes bacterium]|nr:M28 family peptidase [Bacillota bacterium]
ALNINLDMIGSAMGKFIAVVSAEKQLVDFIKYYSVLEGWSIEARSGVYSSDSTPFADKGVPAVSFARIATANQATIHGRYDTMEVMSMPQLEKDIDFLSAFALRFIGAPACPVGREMPDDVKKQLDEYLGRKRKDQ